MNSDTRWRHFRIGWFLIICAAVSGNLDALAQPVSSEGVLSVASWPDFDDRQVVRDLRNNNFFPSVDTLNVGYRYWVRNDRPNGELIIEWTPGTRGIYRGDLTSMAKIPASFRLIALDMVADVVVGDQVVDALVLQIDSLSLEPSPAVSRIDDGDIPWDRLFESRDEQKARAHLESGFQLRSMRVIRMAFRAERISDERSEGKVGVAEPDGVPGPGGPLEPADPAEPDWGSVVYVPDIQVWLDWTLGGAPYYVPIVAPRPLDPVEPRGDRGRGGLTSGDNGRPSYRGPRRDDDLAEPTDMVTTESGDVDGTSGDAVDSGGRWTGVVGRSGSGVSTQAEPRASEGRAVSRSGEREAESAARDRGNRAEAAAERERGDDGDKKKRGGSSKSGKSGGSSSDSDDDDDDQQLLPAALAGVAAVGALAVIGGTIGYYGHGSDAPIGVSAGFVRPDQGILLQVAVNGSVLGMEGGAEHLFANVTYFRSLSRKFPIQPAAALGMHAREEVDTIHLSLTVSFGAAANVGPVVLLGMYDVVTRGAEFGVAFNFRAL